MGKAVVEEVDVQGLVDVVDDHQHLALRGVPDLEQLLLQLLLGDGIEGAVLNMLMLQIRSRISTLLRGKGISAQRASWVRIQRCSVRLGVVAPPPPPLLGGLPRQPVYTTVPARVPLSRARKRRRLATEREGKRTKGWSEEGQIQVISVGTQWPAVSALIEVPGDLDPLRENAADFFDDAGGTAPAIQASR